MRIWNGGRFGIVETLESRTLLSVARVAVVGDFGADSPAEGTVANLIKGWDTAAQPLDGIVTAGDNNYGAGEWSTIDKNIGKYFSDYIGNYAGSYGPGAAVNKFFPSPGNHDWDSTVDHDGDGIKGLDPYLEYFTLPGNERYYDFVLGPIHFFMLDSDPREPSGRSASSAQAQWLQPRLEASTAPWQVVLLHHAPYSSSASHGSDLTMRWPFAQWGADMVIAGHDHDYERLSADGIPYFVNGTGGRSLYGFGTPIAESQVRYNADYGAQLIEASDTSLTISFYNSGYLKPVQLIDSFTTNKGAPLPQVSFQQGVSGYAGTVDTHLSQANPTTSYAATTQLNVDSDEPAGTNNDVQALLRFDNIFGSGVGQIPAGATINSATLELQITNPGNSINLHRVLRSWSATDTWSAMGAGIQADGVEAVATADRSTGAIGATGKFSIDVTTSLVAWLANPSTNLGWVMLPTGTDGVDFYSSEGTTPPRLVVTYTPGGTPAMQIDQPSGETPVYGMVGGTYVNTLASDDSYESIAEVIWAGKKKTRLEHRWQFNVTGGTSTTFFVEAHRTSGIDSFTFQYTTDGGTTWLPMLTVSKTADDDQYQSFDMPAGTSGAMLVRVIDTDSSSPERVVESVYIDEMFFRSTSLSLPTVTIAASDAAASEAGDAGGFVMSRDGTSGDLTVFLSIGGSAVAGTDYAAIPAQVTIPDGQTSVVFSVNPIQDAVFEGDEDVVVSVAPNLAYRIGTQSSAAMIISDDDPAPVVPAAPSNLVGTAISPTQVRLDWMDNSTNEDGFQIEYSTSASFDNVVTMNVAADTTSYTISGLTRNTVYYFRVRAYTAGAVSTYSNILKIRTNRK